MSNLVDLKWVERQITRSCAKVPECKIFVQMNILEVTILEFCEKSL